MLKCKECGSDLSILRRSHIVPSTVWFNCNCEDSLSFYVPEYIPKEQIERYLEAKVQVELWK